MLIKEGKSFNPFKLTKNTIKSTKFIKVKKVLSIDIPKTN